VHTGPGAVEALGQQLGSTNGSVAGVGVGIFAVSHEAIGVGRHRR